MSLKQDMEIKWKYGGCENPLEPARWGFGLGGFLSCLNSILWNYTGRSK